MHAHINRKSKNYSNTFKVDFMKCLGKKCHFGPTCQNLQQEITLYDPWLWTYHWVEGRHQAGEDLLSGWHQRDLWLAAGVRPDAVACQLPDLSHASAGTGWTQFRQAATERHRQTLHVSEDAFLYTCCSDLHSKQVLLTSCGLTLSKYKLLFRTLSSERWIINSEGREGFLHLFHTNTSLQASLGWTGTFKVIAEQIYLPSLMCQHANIITKQKAEEKLTGNRFNWCIEAGPQLRRFFSCYMPINGFLPCTPVCSHSPCPIHPPLYFLSNITSLRGPRGGSTEQRSNRRSMPKSSCCSTIPICQMQLAQFSFTKGVWTSEGGIGIHPLWNMSARRIILVTDFPNCPTECLQAY